MQRTIPPAVTVAALRAASRDLVRALGFMERTLAGTELPPSGVHALIEIGRAGTLRAVQLTEALGLDKSTVSRLVGALVRRGLVEAAPATDDRRGRQLTLTAAGVVELAAIDRFADARVTAALDGLDEAARASIVQGVSLYARALGAPERKPHAAPVLVGGLVPGLAGRIIEMHAAYYAKRASFGAAFEAVVAEGLAGFLPRAGNGRNGLWHARVGGCIVGSIAIDGEDLGGGVAHLRWFIVEPGCQGLGLGRGLLERALAFVDTNGFAETRLWTFQGLDAARSLYEAHGFTLQHAYEGDQWGAPVTEQVFVRRP